MPPFVPQPGPSLKILSRYVLREHIGPLTFALGALTSLLLLNYIAKQFGNLVGKGLPWSAIAEFFVLSVPFTVAMTLPMAVLVGVLYAFSRLAAENEITAMKASGVSMVRVLVPVLVGAAVLALVMIVFNDQVLSRANHRLRILTADIARKKPTFALRAQVINEVSPGKLFLRAGHIEEASNRMREVTIFDLSDATRRRTIYADSGDMGLAPGDSDLQLMLYSGYMQEIPTADPAQLQRLFYRVDNIRIPGVGNEFTQSKSDTYKSDREMSICEMQQAYVAAAREYETTAGEFRGAVRAAAREAVTGQGPSPGRPGVTVHGTPRAPVGIGGIYCALLATVVRLPEARAAVLGPRADSAMPPLPPRYGAVTESYLSGVRSRLEDAARTMDSYDVEIQKKFAISIACVVFVLLGAPIALRFPRGGVGLTIGVSLAVFALYYVGLIAGEALADRDLLPPFWAMWAANILFTAVGLVFLARMGKEGSTARGGDLSEFLETARAWAARQARRAGVPLDRRARTT